MSPSAEPPLGVRASLEVARTLWVLREVAGVCPIFSLRCCGRTEEPSPNPFLEGRGVKRRPSLALRAREGEERPHLSRSATSSPRGLGEEGRPASERRATQEEEEPSVGTGLMRRVLLGGPCVCVTYWMYVTQTLGAIIAGTAVPSAVGEVLLAHAPLRRAARVMRASRGETSPGSWPGQGSPLMHA